MAPASVNALAPDRPSKVFLSPGDIAISYLSVFCAQCVNVRISGYLSGNMLDMREPGAGVVLKDLE